MRNSSRASTTRRFLGHETLESRNLLAGIVADALCSPWQNPLDANDLNTDGSVTAADALVAINSINGGASGDLAASLAPPTLDGFVAGAAADYLDATGDGHLSPADALAVINAINEGLPGGAIRNLPLDDQQGDTIDDQDPPVPTLEFGRGFARVLAAINSAGDVDVFRIIPSKTNLNVSLFSAGRVAMTVSLVVVDGAVPTAISTLATATTEAGSRRPAKIDFDVEAGTEYFLRVAGAANETTGIYGLSVLNYADDQFRPTTDSELGNDKHGGTASAATPLLLNNNVHAHVRSNIDVKGDVDSFLVQVTDGKLIVHGGAAFDLSLEFVQVFDENGDPVVATPISGDRRVVGSVTTGTYMVSVKAADNEDIGPYRLNIVNVPIPRGVPHDANAALAALYGRLDADKDAKLTKEELKPGVPLDKIPVLDQIFNNWDADNDGALDFAEFEAGVDDLHRRAAIHTPIRDFIGRIRRR